MTTYRIHIAFAGREQMLTVRAERCGTDAAGNHVFYDEHDRAVAWVPGGIVIEIREG